MIIKKGWQKRFADRINKEILTYKKEGRESTDRKWIVLGIKDTVYLLGECMNEKEYSFANGFQKFCKEMQIDLEGDKNTQAA